jgi:cell division protein FtsB
MVEQLRRGFPLKFDVGTLFSMLVVLCGIVWMNAQTNAILEQTRSQLQQANETLKETRLATDVRISALEQKLDGIKDRQAETAVNVGKLQSDMSNLRDWRVFPPPAPAPGPR